MIRVAALVSLALLLACGIAVLWVERTEKRARDVGPEIDANYRFLVVTIEAPPGWEEQHTFSMRWEGKTVQLPIVFRAPASDNDFQMGAGAEIFHYLEIGKQRVDVRAEPDVDFRVSNTGAFAILPEKSSRNSNVGLSIATWVAVSPPEQPGEVSPNGGQEETMSASKKLKERLQALLAAGRVIDVPPSALTE